MHFEHKGMKFDVSGLPVGKYWMGLVYRLTDDEKIMGRGMLFCEPDAVLPNGPFVYFSTEAEAESAARSYVVQDLLRD